MIRLETPLQGNKIQTLRIGTAVLLTGELFTARDQAHKRMVESLQKGKRLPINLKESIIYYCGPTPAPKGEIIGSCGPTTSSRMDGYTPFLMRHGLRYMIGKGSRSVKVIASIKKHNGAYFYTFGGCGAFLQEKVVKKELVAYEDLGPEAIYRLVVKDFPLIVANNASTGSLFWE